MATDVTLLGTGLLGAPMARRLLDTGLAVTVWNRTAAKAEALGVHGAAVAGSPAEALEASPVSLLMLADAPAIRRTVFSPEAAARLGGRTLVQMGTIGPGESVALAAEAAASGAAWLEAPVLGSIPEALSGTLQVLAGGSEDDVERLTPLLSRLGTVRRVGAVGTAAALKLALNQLIATLTAAFATSLAYVRAEGVPVETFLDVLRRSALHAPTFDKKLPRMLAHDYTRPNFPVKHLLKDVSLFVAAAGAAGIDARLARAAGELAGKAIAMGLGETDYSAVARAVEPATPGAGER